MRKVIFTILLMAWAMGMTAQNANQKARMKEIRETYAKALELIKMGQEEIHMDCSMHITTRRNVAGIGVQDHRIDFFCEDQSDEETGVAEVSPYLIRAHYNVAARQFSNEYLMHDDYPIFIYLVGDDSIISGKDVDMKDGKCEVRLYFNEDGSLCYGYSQVRYPDGKTEIIEKSYDAESNVVLEHLKTAGQYMHILNQTMNYND